MAIGPVHGCALKKLDGNESYAMFPWVNVNCDDQDHMANEIESAYQEEIELESSDDEFGGEGSDVDIDDDAF
eukprot:gene4259-4824_t